MPDIHVKKLLESANRLMVESGRDLFVFSGEIGEDTSHDFIQQVIEHHPRRSKALMFLCTYGGDPHAAYRLARLLKRCYPEDIRILIGGQCKSAGTLVALCADSLGFSEIGELGPLDTQLSRPDEVLQQASGLEVFSTLQYLTDHAFSCFEKNMLTIISKSGQTVSTRLASEIASRLATGLLKPITAQLDPYRIGMAQRGLEVTRVYGNQLANKKNLKGDAATVVNHLVNHYPTHEFVIDREEASTLFQHVDAFSSTEQAIFDQMLAVLSVPADEPVIINFAAAVAGEASQHQQEGKDDSSEQLHRENQKNGAGQPSGSASEGKPNGRHAPTRRKGLAKATDGDEVEGSHIH